MPAVFITGSNRGIGLESIDPDVLQEITDILSNHFQQKIAVKSVIILSEPSRRNLVLRIILKNTSVCIPNSIIFKQSNIEQSSEDDDDKEAFGRFARDWAGLEFLNNLNTTTTIAPIFYGGSIEHRFILIEDLGPIHISLVDSLMGQERNTAEATLNRYMNVMATLHGASHSFSQKYHTIIQKINPGASMWQDDFDDMFAKISALLEKFNIQITDNLRNEISQVFNSGKEPSPFTALMHGDMCPHNVFDDPAQNKMRIIDFEWCFYGNVLLDAVGLRMCMPTSWCVKAFPEDIIESYEQIYRKKLIKYSPEASDDTVYYEHYVAACAYWMLWRVVSLDDILETDIDIHDQKFPLHPMWKPEYNLRRPRSLYRFKAFIEISKKHNMLPHLRAMAKSILQELNKRWLTVEPLALYPAFHTK